MGEMENFAWKWGEARNRRWVGFSMTGEKAKTL